MNPVGSILKTNMVDSQKPQLRKRLASEPIQFQKHQPERRRRLGAYLFCNGGCCCCCCCLHSLGGLIGATAAGLVEPAAAGPVARCYWTCFAALGLAAAGFVMSFGNESGAVVGGIVVVLICLPVLQLVASLATLVWILMRATEFPDTMVSVRALGRITLAWFVGSVLGAIVMVIGSTTFK